MNPNSDIDPQSVGKARWIGAGFVAAFAASVFTVIYTGLMVEGTRSEFDDASRFVTMSVAEEYEIELFFESPAAFEDISLEVSLPEMLELVGPGWSRAASRPVSLEPGPNELAITVRATAAGKGYLVTRVIGDKPIGLNSFFVTVVAD
jgi:hypothetical protein